MQRAFHIPICVTCRLRCLIKTKEIARTRKAIIPATRRSFGTRPTTSIRRYARFYATARVREGRVQRREAEFVEDLYTNGIITRDEWRQSVWIQAGMQRDEKGDLVGDGNENMNTEDQVRRVHEWYSGEVVPAQLLEQDEIPIYERLFGKMRTVEVSEISEEDLEESGTGVLRQAEDGELEEVEFDDEELDMEVDEERPLSSRRTPANIRLAEDIRAAFSEESLDATSRDTANALDEADEEDAQEYQRNHPLTIANRFTTFPSTLPIPKDTFSDPVTQMLSNLANVHISEAAHRIFGGPGLPYSTSTPTRGKTMQQKPIALDAYQGSMAEMDGDVYMSTIMPGVYSSVMSVLTETRKRMGTGWAEGLVRKAEAGELRILDAGGGGAGILAVREMLRAEWERMHEDGHGDESPMALAEVGGKLGGAGVAAPTGKATVLVGSKTLEKRVSKLLDNTTFIPRLPDYVHAEEAAKKGKFDLIIAPHMLWPLREDYLRKTHVQNLWSLLSTDGGILLLLEKGVARGFELIASAREMLLNNHIASVDSPDRQTNINEPLSDSEKQSDSLHLPKEPGMLIAPCTNHSSCPMYTPKGLVKGRRDFCAFSQRYHRPPFLQHIFGTKGRNHEDVEFSYISVMRGRSLPSTISQNKEVTDLAFAGYEKASAVESLALPRSILPPLKRHGHVIIDLCTPAGTLERWTIPKSFSKQAYRDAKKSSWGDLWALGAKTRVPRSPKVKKHPNNSDDYADNKAKKSNKKRKDDVGLGSDDYGRIVVDGQRVGFDKGRVRSGKKVKGIRDKRDKKASGNGRRRSGEVD